MLYNTSRPIVRADMARDEAGNEMVGHYRESRICNVHVLVQPHYKGREDVLTYPDSLVVREGGSVYLIAVSSLADTDEVRRERKFFITATFNTFLFEVSKERGVVVGRWCACPPCKELFQAFPLQESITGPIAHKVYEK